MTPLHAPFDLRRISRTAPVLIAGPTASGKSALAMDLADRDGRLIVNADALQVFSDWRVLTARPTVADEARLPHALYGHVPGETPYSVGAWLRDMRPLLTDRPLVIVGGTGLYFSALTEGLAEIPETPTQVRATAMARIAAEGAAALATELDEETRRRIDMANPMRVQRAWEVLTATGRPIWAWQDETPPPLLPISQAEPILVDADRDWLGTRIARRFTLMLETGALDEARANRPTWRPDLPSAKAIGAAELMAYLDGRVSLEDTTQAGIVSTRQFAKRQRSWFRSRMAGWTAIPLG